MLILLFIFFLDFEISMEEGATTAHNERVKGCGQLTSQFTCTVAPLYNEPRYNEDPVTTNNNWKPSRITVKYVETIRTITNSQL